MKIKTILCITSLLGSVSSVAADTYQVSTSVYSNGEWVASPVMVVEADKMSSITIGEDFSYRLTVKPNHDETADVITAVSIKGQTLNPTVTLAYDKEATIEIGSEKITLNVSKAGDEQ